MLKSSCLILFAGLFSANAFAALGDQVDAIPNDKQNLRATSVKKGLTTAQYSVQELSTPSALVKEFVNSDGTVFAVSWSGMKRPDLATLLGGYFEEYSAANVPVAKEGRRSAAIESARVVVRRGGHMRDIHGMAYVKALLPAGVAVEDLK